MCFVESYTGSFRLKRLYCFFCLGVNCVKVSTASFCPLVVEDGTARRRHAQTCPTALFIVTKKLFISAYDSCVYSIIKMAYSTEWSIDKKLPVEWFKEIISTPPLYEPASVHGVSWLLTGNCGGTERDELVFWSGFSFAIVSFLVLPLTLTHSHRKCAHLFLPSWLTLGCKNWHRMILVWFRNSKLLHYF